VLGQRPRAHGRRRVPAAPSSGGGSGLRGAAQLPAIPPEACPAGRGGPPAAGMGCTVGGTADTAIVTRPSRATPSGRTYLDLLARARLEGPPADELLTLYVLERFLYPAVGLGVPRPAGPQGWNAAVSVRPAAPDPRHRPARQGHLQ